MYNYINTKNKNKENHLILKNKYKKYYFYYIIYNI